MSHVEIGEHAVAELDGLIKLHHLPPDTWARVQDRLNQLETFPESGAQLSGRWNGLRFMTGPWSWMIIVYRFKKDEDRVTVATIQDGRTSRAATASR